MNRKDLIRRIADVMRDNNIRKPVHVEKHVIHISDNEGNKKDFVIRKDDTSVQYTLDDIEVILETCISVIKDALKRGDNISIRGFGSLGLQYRKARSTKHPVTGEEVAVRARYTPKFAFGNDLRLCAKIYELSMNENLNHLPPIDDYGDEKDGG